MIAHKITGNFTPSKTEKTMMLWGLRWTLCESSWSEYTEAHMQVHTS